MSRALEGSPIPLPITLEQADVLHFLGYPPEKIPPYRIALLLDEAISEARELVNARGVFVNLPLGRSTELGLEAIDAEGLVVGLVTVGDRIDKRMSHLISRGEATRALLLDAAGSAAAEEAADRLGAIITGDAGDEGIGVARAAHVSCRISPGYGRWSISAQEQLFEVLPHRRLDVCLLPSMLMEPRKSISFAMWLGADERPIAGLSGCARCELEQCQYRRVSQAEEIT